MKRFVPLILVALLLATFAPEAAAQYKVAGPDSVFLGDMYSFEHQLGFFNSNTGTFSCSNAQQAGSTDNLVAFDGQTELLDVFTNGTQPFAFEFETTPTDPSLNGFSYVFESVASGGDDLFPAGFTDPGSGSPLNTACLEIGKSDPLDSEVPQIVIKSKLTFVDRDNMTIFSFPITSAFKDPFDGKLSIALTGFTGRKIVNTRLEIETVNAQPLFADGFETGDLSSWSDKIEGNAAKVFGEIDVTNEAALEGNFGMEIDVSDPAETFVQDTTPDGDNAYVAEFRLDPNSVNLADGDRVAIFSGKNEAGNFLWRLFLGRAAGQYVLFLESFDKNGTSNVSFSKAIEDAPQTVGLSWKAAVADDPECRGQMKFFVNGNQVNSEFLVDQNTDGQRLASVQLGLVSGGGLSSGSSGTIFVDGFSSRGPSGSVQPNQAPTANDDAATTDEDVAVQISVLANDSDPDNDPLTVSITGQPPNGAAANNNNVITYTPNGDFNGTDSFTYSIADGNGGTDDATVTITVNPVNDPPTAPMFTSLSDGSTLVLAGDPSALFIVEWTQSTDVDGDDVDYRYEAALDANFNQIFLADDILAAENSTIFVTNVGILADLLKNAGVAIEDFPIDTFHRVGASDGEAPLVVGDTVTVRVERGEITSVGDGVEIPEAFALAGNYPNPFNPATAVSFDVPFVSHVTLEVYDATGRRVAVLADGQIAPGRHTRSWEAGTLASGVYFARMRATALTSDGNAFTAVHAMILAK